MQQYWQLISTERCDLCEKYVGKGELTVHFNYRFLLTFVKIKILCGTATNFFFDVQFHKYRLWICTTIFFSRSNLFFIQSVFMQLNCNDTTFSKNHTIPSILQPQRHSSRNHSDKLMAMYFFRGTWKSPEFPVW